MNKLIAAFCLLACAAPALAQTSASPRAAVGNAAIGGAAPSPLPAEDPDTARTDNSRQQKFFEERRQVRTDRNELHEDRRAHYGLEDTHTGD